MGRVPIANPQERNSMNESTISPKYYAGVGSRETPHAIITLMIETAQILGHYGWTLRSGGAPGADVAFEIGADSVQGAKEIYLPWAGFNENRSNRYQITDAALDLAASYHPGWHHCNHIARKFHARNGYQVLGQDLKTPSRVVVCWTRGAKGGGGTGQAIRIARANEIPVHDLGDPKIENLYRAWVAKYKV